MNSFEQLPMPPTAGLLGHVSFLKKTNIHLQLIEWTEKYGNQFRLRLGIKNVLVLSDPKLVKQLLKSRPDEFRRLKNIESVFEEAQVNGIFSAEGKSWKHQRKLTEPMFQPAHLKHFYPKLKAITSRLHQRFEKLAQSGESVELVSEFKKYTVDVTSLLAFGEDFNSIEQDHTPLSAALSDVFPVVNQRCKSPIPIWRFFKTKKDKQFDISLKKVRDFVSECIEKQKQKLAENPNLKENPENMLQIMLTEQNQDSTLTDKDIISNAITILLAGEDTTANTLAWMAFLISSDNKTSQALEQELADLGDEKVLSWPIPRAPYITAIMYEAMRLKPVAPQLYLEPMRDTKIGDLNIKKGTPIFALLHASGFDSELFESPQSFDPNRWLEKGKASFSDIQPFGSGPRLCPGRSLAIMEIKLAFHTLLQSFHIEALQPPEDVVEQFAFTMSPVGFNVRLHTK